MPTPSVYRLFQTVCFCVNQVGMSDGNTVFFLTYATPKEVASVWDEVNFLHSSPYSAMIWICDSNSVDNIPMF